MGLSKVTDLSKECEKVSRILRTFLDKGKIPAEVVANSKGVAIFSGFRAGMYFAGTGGSGILIARLSNGSWSPPSALSVRSGGFGLVYGVDVYDCVCILNTQEAVDAYTKSEISLGGNLAVTAGPLSANTNTHGKEVQSVWTYTESHGLYGGLTVDGTVIKEKPAVNAEFYGQDVTAAQILRGEVKKQDGASHWPAGSSQLIKVLELIEGKAISAGTLYADTL